MLTGSEDLGYECSEELPSIAHLNVNELSSNLTKSPLLNPWLGIVTVIIPTRASYWAPVTVWLVAACNEWLPTVKLNLPLAEL